ncbi:MAG: sensor histidine kinase [Myxococcota bacterium]
MTSPTRSGSEQPPEEATLRRLADALPLGVMSLRDGCVAWANRTLAALSGRGERILGLKLEDLLADAGRGLPHPADPAPVECRLLQAGGGHREVVCQPVDSVTWILEDVTHVRRLEREMHGVSRDLLTANRECEELRARLEAEEEEREELLSVVSHELRTPVTVIGGYNRLLLEEEVGPLTEEQRGFLLETRKGCERLNGFIGNLLEASRAEKGAHVLELGHGAPAGAIEAVVAMLRPLLEERDMTLSLDLDAEALARFDRLRLEQVLTNLLGNAIKFGRSGGHVEVTSRRIAAEGPGGRDQVEIAIADDGPGVAPADRERVFEPYVQLGDGGRGGGLGLGLAICRRLVEAHGGTIRAASRDGGGARFVFTLPAASTGTGSR